MDATQFSCYSALHINGAVEDKNWKSTKGMCGGMQCVQDAETQDAETQETNVGLAILRHGYGEDDAEYGVFSQLETEASTAFETSFASSITTEFGRKDHMPAQRRPNLPRSPPSPSSPRQYKKRRGVADW